MPDHDHDQHHDDHGHHGSELSDIERRVRALETVLTEKGYIDPAALDRIVEAYETRVGPHIGAAAIARAWVDPMFRAALLANASGAIADAGIATHPGDHLIAVENTPSLHNIVVCTLCSCYPWAVLGLPPVWYKSFAYRSRAVKEPRRVLAEFGVTLSETTQIRVWDSTANTEGWDAERLATLVTRDSMVGTGLARPAAAVP